MSHKLSEGSVFYDSSRGKWVGTMETSRDPGTGKRRRIKVVADTKAQAKQRLRERRRALELGDTASATYSVADLIASYIETVVVTMTPNTAQGYRYSLAAAERGVGAVPLVDLRATHVEAWLRAEAERGRSRATVGRYRVNLARVLRWAQRRDLVARNAAEIAEMPPTPPAKEGRALTVDELGSLLRQAEGTRLEAVWWVMAGLGLRPGEALGLSWPDLDLDSGLVHIRRALKVRNGVAELGDLKTAKSRRTLAMPPQVVAALRTHRRSWTEERLANGSSWPVEWVDLVFCTEAGTPIDLSNLRRDLSRLAKRADVGKMCPYDLRHTAATLIADAGTPLEAVADVLGHQGVRMARDVYVHATGKSVLAAVAPMGAALPTSGLLGAAGSHPGSHTATDAPESGRTAAHA